MKYIPIWFAILFLGCGLHESASTASINATTSACKGFNSLSKSVAFIYQQDSADYCTAEKLRWEYDAVMKTVHFLHTRNLQNCGAKLEMIINKEGDNFNIIENDKSTAKLNCSCYFDTYCDLPSIESASLQVNFRAKSYVLELGNAKGAFVLDSTCNWPCP